MLVAIYSHYNLEYNVHIIFCVWRATKLEKHFHAVYHLSIAPAGTNTSCLNNIASNQITFFTLPLSVKAPSRSWILSKSSPPSILPGEIELKIKGCVIMTALSQYTLSLSDFLPLHNDKKTWNAFVRVFININNWDDVLTIRRPPMKLYLSPCLWIVAEYFESVF